MAGSRPSSSRLTPLALGLGRLSVASEQSSPRELMDWLPPLGMPLQGCRSSPSLRGLVDLNEPIYKFLPEFGSAVVSYVPLVEKVDRGEIRSLAEWCQELAQVPLRFQPGKDWGYGYSSDAVDLAALYKREPWHGSSKSVNFVTCDVGGSQVMENAKKRVLALPKIDSSSVLASKRSVFLEGAPITRQVTQGGGCVCSVAGGLVSSLRDCGRFFSMLVNNGELDGIRLLSPESVQLLRRDWLNDFTTEKRQSVPQVDGIDQWFLHRSP
eukprot:g13981.t1